MGTESLFDVFDTTLRVFLIDLLLSGDNAVIIALACRGLPPAQLRRAALSGIVVAIGARIVLTGLASTLMRLPLLRLVGAVALVVIALKLMLDQERAAAATRDDDPDAAPGYWSALRTIILADAVMSTDNVVALAAASKGDLRFLALGLLFSVPLLMYGSLFVMTLLKRFPILIRGGGAMLAWLAGDIAMADPLIVQDWSQQAPILVDLVPILVAIFVLAESRIIEARRGRFVAPLRALARSSARHDTRTAVAPSRPFVRRALPWLAAAGGVGIVVGVLLPFARMPSPAGLSRFVCPDQSTIYFRHGADAVRMTSYAGTINGLLRFGKLDWGNYELATRTLGFLPPTEITYDDAKELRINGGRFVNIACGAR